MSCTSAPAAGCWSGAFDEPVRCQQIDEDLFAARSVSGVLLAIFCTGALLGAFTVLLATAYQDA